MRAIVAMREELDVTLSYLQGLPPLEETRTATWVRSFSDVRQNVV